MPLHIINPPTEQFFIWGNLIQFEVIYLNHIPDMNQNTEVDSVDIRFLFELLVQLNCYISGRKC